MLAKISCIFLLLQLSIVALGSQQTLTVAINAPGSPPYAYFDSESLEYQGVLVDFMRHYSEQTGVKIKFLDTSRARIEQFILAGKSDFFQSSKEWVNKPARFLFSLALVQHNSYLYAVTPFAADFNLTRLSKQHICTRRGYIYPVLQQYFDKKVLTRVDSVSQKSMASMLQKGRCDFAIMNENNARVAFSRPDFCGQIIYQSPDIVSQVNLGLVMRPELDELLPKLDLYIKKFIDSGDRDSSLRRHTGSLSFPMNLPCN